MKMDISVNVPRLASGLIQLKISRANPITAFKVTAEETLDFTICCSQNSFSTFSPIRGNRENEIELNYGIENWNAEFWHGFLTQNFDKKFWQNFDKKKNCRKHIAFGHNHVTACSTDFQVNHESSARASCAEAFWKNKIQRLVVGKLRQVQESVHSSTVLIVLIPWLFMNFSNPMTFHELLINISLLFITIHTVTCWHTIFENDPKIPLVLKIRFSCFTEDSQFVGFFFKEAINISQAEKKKFGCSFPSCTLDF